MISSPEMIKAGAIEPPRAAERRSDWPSDRSSDRAIEPAEGVLKLYEELIVTRASTFHLTCFIQDASFSTNSQGQLNANRMYRARTSSRTVKLLYGQTGRRASGSTVLHMPCKREAAQPTVHPVLLRCNTRIIKVLVLRFVIWIRH